MNPALMNYLQSQQMNQEGQNSQAPFNPFDVGISRAIESARESLGMTEKQQDKALRRSILTFADNMSQQPVKRGFFNNFGSVARAMSPAIMEHDNYEEQALAQNRDMANQILAHKAAEQNRQNILEQQAWARQHAENQLGEQRRYHDMMGDYQRQKLNNSQQGADNAINNNFGGKYIPFETKQDHNLYTKDKKAIGTAIEQLSHLQKNYGNFRKKYENNIIDPMSPFAKIANPAKDFIGKFADNKTLRAETADREAFGSQLNTFVLGSEQALKGGGILGPKIIETFKALKIYPDLANDTPEILEAKLKRMTEELDKAYKASKLSLQYKLHIDPSEVDDFEKDLSGTHQPMSSQTNESNIFDSKGGTSALDTNILPSNSNFNGQNNNLMNNEQIIVLRNANGTEANIPASDTKAIQDALKDGYKRLE